MEGTASFVVNVISVSGCSQIIGRHDTQHNRPSYDTQHKCILAHTFSITVLIAIMLSVVIT